ncbi:MAG: hypothetical protein L0Y54_09245, partial [Sporichthyaceae bacterium]|nr:hypothetical protein [Sporichthyaceae bacterium]
RVNELHERLGDQRVLCWIPEFLSDERFAGLRRLVKLDFLLSGNRFDENAAHLGHDDRQVARSLIRSQRDQLTNTMREVLKQAYGVARKDPANVATEYDQHVLSLDVGLDPKLPVGASLAEAFTHLATSMWDHTHPKHPDLDPGRTGKEVRARDLDLVLAVVTQAAVAPDGRVETEKLDRPTLRRIANPLRLGHIDEGPFVLSRHWQQEFEQRAAREGIAGDLPVSALHSWLSSLGLDLQVANLVIACYAIIADRTWVRYGGTLNPPPALKEIKADMALRAQRVPDDRTWALAADRAAAVCGIAAPPVKAGRTTAELARRLREFAREHSDHARALVTQLERHAGVLGLDTAPPSARLGTARRAVDLLDSLLSGDDLAVVESLAEADLSASAQAMGSAITSAKSLVETMRAADWHSLGNLPSLADEWQAQTADILGSLRAVAVEDELTSALAPALDTARDAARELIRQALRPAQPPETPQVPPRTAHGARRVAAAGIDAALDELRVFAETHPDTTIVVEWRTE